MMTRDQGCPYCVRIGTNTLQMPGIGIYPELLAFSPQLEPTINLEVMAGQQVWKQLTLAVRCLLIPRAVRRHPASPFLPPPPPPIHWRSQRDSRHSAINTVVANAHKMIEDKVIFVSWTSAVVQCVTGLY
jgi:hypothetical protein